MNVTTTPVAPALPVAALPEYREELRLIVRTKRRPALVLSMNHSEIEAGLRLAKAPWQTAPAMLVAPYYGVEATARSGWAPLLVDRIRRCRYAQYIWDHLPIEKSTTSILRFDHLQGLSMHPHSYKLTGFRLSEDAFQVIHDWYRWFLSGAIDSDSILAVLREEFQQATEEEAQVEV